MQENRIIHLRACVEGLFYKNIVDNDMVTNTINSYVNPYFFLSNTTQNYEFITDSEV